MAEQLSEDQFIERFKPETDEYGDLYRQRDWDDPADLEEIQRAANERRLWTALDADEAFVIASGLHRVNRIYHIICEVPVPAGAEYEIIDD